MIVDLHAVGEGGALGANNAIGVPSRGCANVLYFKCLFYKDPADPAIPARARGPTPPQGTQDYPASAATALVHKSGHGSSPTPGSRCLT